MSSLALPKLYERLREEKLDHSDEDDPAEKTKRSSNCH